MGNPRKIPSLVDSFFSFESLLISGFYNPFPRINSSIWRNACVKMKWGPITWALPPQRTSSQIRFFTKNICNFEPLMWHPCDFAICKYFYPKTYKVVWSQRKKQILGFFVSSVFHYAKYDKCYQEQEIIVGLIVFEYIFKV